MKILNGTIIQQIIENQEISFFVTDDSDLIQRSHAAGKFYEPEELSIIKRYFSGGCFLDVGSNIGNHAIYVAKYLDPSRVICIEPNPSAIEILLINLKLNALINVTDQRYLGIGLAATAGRAALHQVQTNNMGAMRLKAGEGDVRLAVGDDLLQTENPYFLKIDVEGMEINVLQGLQRLIDRCKPKIFMEVDNVNRESFDQWREQHRYLIVERYRRYPQNENFLLLPEHSE